MFTIKELGYTDFIKKNKNDYLSHCLKTNRAKYYQIIGKETVDEIFIFTDENQSKKGSLQLCDDTFLNEKIMNLFFSYLKKKGFNQIEIEINKTKMNLLDKAKQYYFIEKGSSYVMNEKKSSSYIIYEKKL